MKAVVAAFNQEKALVGAFSVITNLRMELFEALGDSPVSTELNEQNNTNHSQKMAGSIITRETLCVDSGLSYLHARFKCSNPA